MDKQCKKISEILDDDTVDAVARQEAKEHISNCEHCSIKFQGEALFLDQLSESINDYDNLTYDKPLAFLNQRKSFRTIVFRFIKWSAAAGFIIFFLGFVLVLVNIKKMQYHQSFNLQSLKAPKSSVSLTFSLPSMNINHGKLFKDLSELSSKTIVLPKKPNTT